MRRRRHICFHPPFGLLHQCGDEGVAAATKRHGVASTQTATESSRLRQLTLQIQSPGIGVGNTFSSPVVSLREWNSAVPGFRNRRCYKVYSVGFFCHYDEHKTIPAGLHPSRTRQLRVPVCIWMTSPRPMPARRKVPSPTMSRPATRLFSFRPTRAIYLLFVCAQLPGRTLPWGPSLRVTATNLPPITIQFAGQPARSGSQFQASFNVANYRSGTPFLLLKASDLCGPWATDTMATVQTIVSNTQFRVTITNSANRQFFRIKAN